MHRDTMINVIKRKIGQQYGTQVAAAEALGMHKNQLNRVLTGEQEEIPQKILDWVGYRKHTVTTYVRK